MLKFSCEKALLQNAAATASRAVSAKSSIPALEGLLLEGGERLTLSGYNTQTGIRTCIEADVNETGRIVLNGWPHGFGSDGGWVKNYAAWLETIFA